MARKRRMARILLVDDSSVVRRFLRHLLEDDAGMTVCAEASNGQEAVNQALESRPDLIVLDLSMPIMNGLDAAPLLKRLLPAVPIIMFTSFDSCGVSAMAAAAGISTVVDKSSPGSLVVAVRALLTAVA